ncbi:MAG TPA: hypothetical protein VFU79_07440 [Nitrososphaeraceae archaeon]|nr:hypothetical protein [Nitrososphaeraceae archaeon]
MKNNGSILLILFLILPILVISISQFVYAQTVENEIGENTLENEKATGKNALEIDKVIPSNLKITESAANNTTPDMGNATVGTESAITETPETTTPAQPAGTQNKRVLTLFEADEFNKMKKTAPPAQPETAQETAPPAQPEGTERPSEEPAENGGNFLDQITGWITNLFK